MGREDVEVLRSAKAVLVQTARTWDGLMVLMHMLSKHSISGVPDWKGEKITLFVWRVCWINVLCVHQVRNFFLILLNNIVHVSFW